MRRVGLAVAAATLGVAVPVLGTTGSAASPTAASSARVQVVLTIAPGTAIPYQPAGTRVVRAFPHLGSELVATTRARIALLRRDPAVIGVARNWHGRVAGHDAPASGTGVLGPEAIGGIAGRPNAGAGVTVALLDTGVNDTPALNRASGRLVDGIDVSRLSAGGSASTTGPFTDGYGHGTFMASLIAGGKVPGSGSGGIGVAPAAKVDVVKVADAAGRTSLLQVLAGLNWVATQAKTIQVVNLSLAVSRPTAPAYGADPLTWAVQHVREAGVLPVAAAGNQPNQVGDPGLTPQALTVGAVDTSGKHARVAAFSGSGTVAGVRKPDLVAPGLHVLGVESPGTAIAKSNPRAWTAQGLFLGSGTSESTALTTGAAAAYLGEHPGSTPLQVKTALRSDARSLAGGKRAGAGLVSLGASAATQGSGHDRGKGHGHGSKLKDPSGEASYDGEAFAAEAWLGGKWVHWMASSWSASSWSASSWSASSWSASSWSASSWSASSWSASSWSASSWSDEAWGPAP